MPNRKRLPSKRKGIRITIGTGSDKVVLSTGEYEDGSLGEIFLDHQREGTFGRDMMHAFSMAISIGLQYGVPIKSFLHTFRDFKMQPDLVRQIFEALDTHYSPDTKEVKK